MHVKQFGWGFALGEGVVVHHTPFFIITFDVVGIVRAKFNDRILVADAVLIIFIAFGFAFFGILICFGGRSFVATVG